MQRSLGRHESGVFVFDCLCEGLRLGRLWSRAHVGRAARNSPVDLDLRAATAVDSIKPGHPQQNGRHERMHLTLKKEATKPPATAAAFDPSRLERGQFLWATKRPSTASGVAEHAVKRNVAFSATPSTTSCLTVGIALTRERSMASRREPIRWTTESRSLVQREASRAAHGPLRPPRRRDSWPGAAASG